MNLRDYQSACLDKSLERYQEGVNRQLAVLATGLGKAVLFAGLRSHHGFQKRVMVLVHREELAAQAADKIHRWNPGLMIGTEMASRYAAPMDSFVVASVPTLGRRNSARLAQFRPEEFDCIVSDECFPAGTLIDGKPIEKIVVGDMIMSYDESSRTFSKQRVVRLFKNPEPRTMVTIRSAGREFTCTANHPIYTDSGWRNAANVRSGDGIVYGVRLKGRHNGATRMAAQQIQKDWTSLLFGALPRFIGATGEVGDDGAHEPQIRLRENDQKQSDAQRRKQTENEKYPAGDRPQTKGAWWQWDGNDLRPGNIVERSWKWMVAGIFGSDATEAGFWLPRSVQVGLGVSCLNAWRRSGREQSLSPVSTGTGQEEGFFPVWVRVDSVEVQEQGSSGKSGDGFVYNLEVENTHTYFANDFLVHNCHHSISPQWRRVLGHFGLMASGAVPILSLGLTATPNRSDGTGLRHCFDEIVFDMGIDAGIRSGYLVDLRCWRISTKTNLDGVHTTAGDFKANELADAVNNPQRNGMIVKAWANHAWDKKSIAFTVDIQHALDLAAAFQAFGVPAAAVWGDDPERAEKLRKHRAGEITVLCNCAVLCLDLETEVLTDKGWTKWDQMTMVHKVANWNFDGSVFFEEPKEIVVRPLADTEHMVSVATPRANFRVTNTHRMIVGCAEGSKKWKKIAAQELRKGHVLPSCGVAEPVPFERPTGAGQYSYRRVSANAYNLRRNKGMGMLESEIEAQKREMNRVQLTTKSPDELTLDECRFIGFWIADGSKNSSKVRGGVEWTLSQATAYPTIVSWVDDLIKRMGVNVARYDKSNHDNPHIRWSLCRGTGGGKLLRKGIYHLEPYLKKNGTHLFWSLNEKQFDALAEGYWYGDGKHGDAKRGFPSNPSFADTKKEWIELLSAIGSVRGWKCSTSYVPPRKDHHSPQWSLRMIKQGKYQISYKTDIKHEPYAPEQVWCIKTTSKNIITRRKGRVVVMGNTEGYDDPGVECIVLARPTKSSLLLTQMIGRGTRLPEGAGHIDQVGELGKRDCIILDVADATEKHEIATVPSLLGMPKNIDMKGQSYQVSKEKLERVAKEFPTANLADLKDLTKLDHIAQQVSLFAVKYPPEISQMTELAWRQQGDGYFLPVKKERLTLARDLRDEWWVRGTIDGKPIEIHAQNLAGAFNAADREVLADGERRRLLERGASWRELGPSQKQIDLCRRLGLDIPAGATRGMVSAAIDAKMSAKRMTA